jgi:branched-chain amino acid transport system substrate-binding protein
MKGRFAKLLVLSVVGLFVSAVSGLAMAADTIKLGVAGAHSGDFASYGIPTLRAAELVVKKVNSSGGVLGKKVVLLVEDDGCKPEFSTSAATKLVSENADVVLGHTCNGATKAALGIYLDSKTIVMSSSATKTALTLSGDYPNFYRTIANDEAQAELQVMYATKYLKTKKVAVLHDKGDYGKGQAELAKKFFEKAGVEVVLFEGVTLNAVDYSAIVQKMERSKADLVIWGGYYQEASKIVTLMRKKKMKTLFMGADEIKDDIFIKVAGKAAEGVYATGPNDVSKNQLFIDAKNAHQKAYGSDPGSFFDSGYAAALALLNAIEKAGSTNYNAIAKALKSQYVETPIGKISFDKNGDAIGAGFAVFNIKNGKFVEMHGK